MSTEDRGGIVSLSVRRVGRRDLDVWGSKRDLLKGRSKLACSIKGNYVGNRRYINQNPGFVTHGSFSIDQISDYLN